jgi:phage gp36-like protein
MYCTTADVVQEMSERLVAQSSDDVNGTSVNVAVVEDLIQKSTNDIDDYLRGRYALPIDILQTATLSTLRQFCTTLTICRLYARRLNGKKLVKIQRGERILAASGAGEGAGRPGFYRSNGWHGAAFPDDFLNAY